MIAYVQKYSLRYWYHKINEWIVELATGTRENTCVWNESELLEMLDEHTSEEIAKYYSIHARMGNNMNKNIKVYHLWIVMDMK